MSAGAAKNAIQSPIPPTVLIDRTLALRSLVRSGRDVLAYPGETIQAFRRTIVTPNCSTVLTTLKIRLGGSAKTSGRHLYASTSASAGLARKPMRLPIPTAADRIRSDIASAFPQTSVIVGVRARRLDDADGWSGSYDVHDA